MQWHPLVHTFGFYRCVQCGARVATEASDTGPNQRKALVYDRGCERWIKHATKKSHPAARADPQQGFPRLKGEADKRIGQCRQAIAIRAAVRITTADGYAGRVRQGANSVHVSFDQTKRRRRPRIPTRTMSYHISAMVRRLLNLGEEVLHGVELMLAATN